MSAPLQYELVHLQRADRAAAHAVVRAGYVVICWDDGVREVHRALSLDEVISAQYGGQYYAQLARDSVPVRYALTETATGKPKGYAFVWKDEHVTIIWDDEVVEDWDNLDAVVDQYAFEYIFANLDR